MTGVEKARNPAVRPLVEMPGFCLSPDLIIKKSVTLIIRDEKTENILIHLLLWI
jgi:hypothetical protein